MWRGVRWWRNAPARQRLLLGGAGLILILVLSTRSDVTGRVERVFGAEPRALAHLLADWRTQRTLQPDLSSGTWRIEEESGSAVEWRYSVSAECGARCSHRSWVVAREHGADHEVRLRARTCRLPPLLPWPENCEEWQSVTHITAAGSGSRLVEVAEVHCARWDGGCGKRLQQALAARLQRLTTLLQDAL